MESCVSLEKPVTRFTPAVANVAHGLKAAGKGKFRFPDFIRSERVLRVLKHEPAHSQFAQLAFCAYLFALRVPSEALILRRAYDNDQLEHGNPQLVNGLISARQEGSQTLLILKIPRRQNLPTGCGAYRPCFCNLGQQAPKPHVLCPVHFWWRNVCARVAPGHLLFTDINPRNVNRVIKKAMEKLNAVQAHRYTSHGFRRWGEQEPKERGPQRTTVAGAGGWRSLAFRGYVDTAEDISRAMAKLLIDDIDPDESDFEEEAVRLFAGKPHERVCAGPWVWVFFEIEG